MKNVHHRPISSGIKKAKTVPETIVSATQWYEKNPVLFKQEVAAMYKTLGDKAKLIKLKSGKIGWLVSIRPRVPSKAKCGNCTMRACEERIRPSSPSASGIGCCKYDLLLLYDSDHPQPRHGSSIKAIPLRPSISDMQKQVDSIPRIKGDKGLNHLISSDGELSLCIVDQSNTSADPNSSKGITTAAFAYRRAAYYLNVFECALIDHDANDRKSIWYRYKHHGEI